MEHLILKWGGIKGWSDMSDASIALLQKRSDLGFSMSAALQHNTSEQKVIICELIDQLDGTIRNDWTGEDMTKDAAKAYVMDYGK